MNRLLTVFRKFRWGPSAPVFVRLFALFVLPFGILSSFFLFEQFNRIKEQLHASNLLQMQLVAQGIENRIKDSAHIDSSNPLLIESRIVKELDDMPLPRSLLAVSRRWFRETNNRAFLYLYHQDRESRLLYIKQHKQGWALFVFQSQFLEDYLLTSSSLEATDVLLLFNYDGTPALSNLIEADFRVPNAWKNMIAPGTEVADIVRTVTVSDRSFLTMTSRLPGLPVSGLLAKPYDIAFRGLLRTLYIDGALLALVFVFSIFLSRTFARYEVRLVEAREEALRAAKARADFLSTMSHEIRTPLNAILGAAELLNETKLDTNQSRYLSIFRRAGKLLLELINDILDFSRVEAGQIAIEAQPFSVSVLVEEVSEMFRHYRKDQAVALVGEVADGVPDNLYGDVRHIRQIISNLVSNALKFTKQGNVTIRVEPASSPRGSLEPGASQTGTSGPAGSDSNATYLSSHSGERCALQFSVSDTGVGIPADKLQSVFESYSRVGEDDSVSKGTGLGLAIASRLTRALGGELQLESTLGQGSRFYFTLPFVLNNEVPIRTLEAGASPTATDAPPAAMKILLADDNEDNRLLFSTFLKKIPGLQLEMVEDGLQALSRCSQEQFDAILMDMSMPQMDGFEATQKIREIQRKSGLHPTPIIALTAYTSEDDIQRCLKAGCSDYLTKPIERDLLIRRVREVVAQDRRARAGG